jgi:flagellar basal-body rod protein FlgF
MDVSSYVALSGQLTLEQRMSTLASNIANANTPGFKAGTVNFKTIMTAAGIGGAAFAATSSNTLDMSNGGMTNTGNPLDLATAGGAAFAYESSQGTYFSHDGRLTITPDGQLQNLQGHALLDASSAPISVDPTAGEATIGRDGSLFQNGKRVGQIGLFAINLADGFDRVGSSGIVPKSQPEPISDFTNYGVLQGFIEGSNVNAVTEMVNLIDVSRAFEAASTFADKAMEAERNAIEALGARS